MFLRRTRTERPVAAVVAPATALAMGFSEREWRTLLALRARYRQDRDLFTGQDMARLRFACWLVETERLTL